jgi:hypothetical protein
MQHLGKQFFTQPVTMHEHVHKIAIQKNALSFGV